MLASVNFVSNPFSGAGCTPKNPFPQERSVISAFSVFREGSGSHGIVYFIHESVVNTERKLTTFSSWTYRGEFVLFAILRLSIFILQSKELPKYLTRTSDS